MGSDFYKTEKERIIQVASLDDSGVCNPRENADVLSKLVTFGGDSPDGELFPEPENGLFFADFRNFRDSFGPGWENFKDVRENLLSGGIFLCAVGKDEDGKLFPMPNGPEDGEEAAGMMWAREGDIKARFGTDALDLSAMLFSFRQFRKECREYNAWASGEVYELCHWEPDEDQPEGGGVVYGLDRLEWEAACYADWLAGHRGALLDPVGWFSCTEEGLAAAGFDLSLLEDACLA